MELMSAKELYEVSRIKHNDETIADALWRAAISGSVELFVHGIDEATKNTLIEKGYHIEAGNYPVGEGVYEYQIYWGRYEVENHMEKYKPTTNYPYREYIAYIKELEENGSALLVNGLQFKNFERNSSLSAVKVGEIARVNADRYIDLIQNRYFYTVADFLFNGEVESASACCDEKTLWNVWNYLRNPDKEIKEIYIDFANKIGLVCRLPDKLDYERR